MSHHKHKHKTTNKKPLKRNIARKRVEIWANNTNFLDLYIDSHFEAGQSEGQFDFTNGNDLNPFGSSGICRRRGKSDLYCDLGRDSHGRHQAVQLGGVFTASKGLALYWHDVHKPPEWVVWTIDKNYG